MGRLDRLGAAAAGSLLEGLRRLPEQRALQVGAALGRSWARLGGPRVETARVNLRIAFPEWREEARERVLRRSLEGLGRSLAEFAWLGRWSPQELRQRVQIEGLVHLEKALAATHRPGALILTAHFGS